MTLYKFDYYYYYFYTPDSKDIIIVIVVIIVTQRRSVVKHVGCFQRNLFVCVWVCAFVNMITSERVTTG